MEDTNKHAYLNSVDFAKNRKHTLKPTQKSGYKQIMREIGEKNMGKNAIWKDQVDLQIDTAGKQIRIIIASHETKWDILRSETIRHSGMSQANFYKAWKDPSLFRIGQLIRIYDFLKVPEPERRFT